jgi:hypothetical protein
MTPDDIIAQLLHVQRRPPVAALRAAEAHRAELTPRLLACLAEVVARPAMLEEDGDLQLPFFAMYLLAAWRETQAHALLLGFLRLPGDQCVDLSGDIVTQDMARMLAQTAGGEPRGIAAVAGDPAVNEWARVAAIKALSLMTAWGELPRETLVAQYRALIAAAGPPRERDDPGPVMAEFVCCALDLQLVELRDELLALMDRGWIDESIVGSREEVAAEFGQPPWRPPEKPIDNVVEAIGWWGCYGRDDGIPQPYRAPPKVGRNDPCPCGSGKKFKKCCGR